MFSKITIIAIVAFVATTDGSKVWDGYSARWADDPTQGFRQLPTTYSQATKGGWTRVIDTKLPRGVMLLCYDHDVTFGLLFSIRTSKVVGHQIALPAADLDNSCSPIDYNGKPGFTKKIYNRQYYYAALAMYAEDEEKGRQISIEMNGKFVKIPTKYDQVLSKTSYYSKQCVKWMGHHFYQVNSTTGIHDFPPWAFLSVGEDIIGIVFQAIGKVSTSGYIKWFENVDTSKTADVIPDACTELKEGIQKYGLISLHIYFKKNPVQIVCRDKCTAVYNAVKTSNFMDHIETSRRHSGERILLGSVSIIKNLCSKNELIHPIVVQFREKDKHLDQETFVKRAEEIIEVTPIMETSLAI